MENKKEKEPEPAKEEQKPSEPKPEQAAADSATVEEPATAPEPEKAEQPAKPVFKVQILTASKKLSTGDSRLKGLKDVAYYQENGVYKYTVGNSTDYNEIYRLRKEIVGKFPEAFIIAFKNGERMDVQEAIREFKNNKNKK